MTDHEKILVALLSNAEIPDDLVDRIRPLELMALLRDAGSLQRRAART